MIEHEVTFNEMTYPLRGTLTIPNDETPSFPAILIVPGTGPNNRDGNNRFINLNIYKQLAEFLTTLGFVTLRYDKRGIGKSEGNYWETGFWDFVDDAEQALHFLKQHESVDDNRIVIIGHSEGCMISPVLYTRQKVNGLVLLAGVAEASNLAFQRQRDLAIQQLLALTGWKGRLMRLLRIDEKAAQEERQIEEKILNSNEAVVRFKGKKVNAKWLREQYSFNVMDYLPSIDCPVLAVTGSKDIQVLPEHAEKIAETVAGPAEWHVVPNMTHILKQTDEQLTILNVKKIYKRQANQSIDNDLQRLLSHWLTRYIVH